MMRQGKPHWNVLRVNRESTLTYHQTIEANLIAEVNLSGQKKKKRIRGRRKKRNKQRDFFKKGKTKPWNNFCYFI